MSDQILDGNVEKVAEALKDSDVIKTAQLDGDKDQSDLYAASSASAGDKTQYAGVTHDDLLTARISVKGIILLLCSVIVDCYGGREGHCRGGPNRVEAARKPPLAAKGPPVGCGWPPRLSRARQKF